MNPDLQRQLELRVEEIVRRLVGEPNRSLSSRSQLRFGRHGSLAVEIDGAKSGQWYDHEAKRGGDLVDLVMHRLGFDRDGALAWLAESCGMASPRTRRASTRRIVATYDYRNEAGTLLMQVVRYAPKTFRQRCPDGRGGWSWKVRGIRPVPYRLFELQARTHDQTVLIVEGEKDVDRLAGLGLIATCNAGGANKWPLELSRHFRDLDLCILPDNDDAGRSHAELVAAALYGTARSIRIVRFPACRPAGTSLTGWMPAARRTNCGHCVLRHRCGSPQRSVIQPPGSPSSSCCRTATKH